MAAEEPKESLSLKDFTALDDESKTIWEIKTFQFMELKNHDLTNHGVHGRRDAQVCLCVWLW